jgi:hypothetical protein
MRNTPNPLTLDKRVPLTLVVGFVLQIAAALWWVAEQSSTIAYLERRLIAVETHQAKTQGQGEDILVRLARIEERQQAQLSLLNDIKTRLNR